jgi:hypothetical protein
MRQQLSRRGLFGAIVGALYGIICGPEQTGEQQPATRAACPRSPALVLDNQGRITTYYDACTSWPRWDQYGKTTIYTVNSTGGVVGNSFAQGGHAG